MIARTDPQLNSVHRERYGRGAPCGAGVRHRNGSGRNAQGGTTANYYNAVSAAIVGGNHAETPLCDNCVITAKPELRSVLLAT